MRRYLFLILMFVMTVHSELSLAQQMDAQLNMAKRSLAQIETKLSNIQPGDVSQYNKLGKKLTKVAAMLKATGSKTHPEYVKSIQTWSGLRAKMVTTAENWKQLNAQNNTQDKVNKTATAGQKPKQRLGSSSVIPNDILAKYQKQNRPTLTKTPSPSDVENWAIQMQALQTTELQKDLSLLKQQTVSVADRERVSRWIGGNFQRQIKQALVDAMQKFNGKATMAAQLAEQIQNIEADDKMRAYNFAHGSNGQRNAKIIQSGLTATANAISLETIFPSLANPQRQQQLSMIAVAQQRLENMTEISQRTSTELAALPKKQKRKKEVYLKGIAQKLWYRGSELASLDHKGSIWMNSTDVGDIESNGTIWVRGNDLGSIEPDGKVWFRGNHIGTLEDNGKVWRNSSHIGTVEMNGKVWVDGNANGEIVPFDGEWKRAAIIYYFRDIFNE